MSLLTELNTLLSIPVVAEATAKKYEWAEVLKAFKDEIFRIAKTSHIDDLKTSLFGTDEFHPWENQGELEKALDSGDIENIFVAMNDAFEESISAMMSYFGKDKDNKPLLTVDFDEHSNTHVFNVLSNGAPELYKSLGLTESKRVFARTRSNKIVRKIRCTAGKRKGRVVNKAADCFKRKNLKLSRKAKLNSKRTRYIRVRKTRLTKRRVVSRTIRRLNANT